MLSTHGLEEEVLALYSKLKAKKQQMQSAYESRMAEVDREIEAVSTTLRLLREPKSTLAPTSVSPTRPYIGARELEGMNSRQALRLIAEKCDGIVKITDAKDILVGAGIIKETKNTWGAIYTTLTRSPEFVKGPLPGTFKLAVDPKQRDLSLAE